LKKKEAKNNHSSHCHGSFYQQNYKSQDLDITAASKNGTLDNDTLICGSGACGHYCKLIEGMFSVKDIEEKFTVGRSNSMMTI
jgi:hypothetical protein